MQIIKICTTSTLLYLCILHNVQAISVSSLTINDGLKTNTVTSITQDTDGYIWLGSMSGLSRYDGYQLLSFRHETDDPRSLSDNHVTDLVIDNRGSLWITTWNGLNRYDPDTMSFDRYGYIQPNYIGGQRTFRSVIAKGKQHLWVGHRANLYRYRYETDALEAIPITTFGAAIPNNDYISSLMEDSQGNIYIGMFYSGLYYYQTQTSTFKKIHLTTRTQHTVSHVTSMVEDNAQNVWLGTSTTGLFVIQKNGDYKHITADTRNPYSLPHQSVNTLLLDQDGTLWVGTSEGLGEKFDDADAFISYRFNASKQRGLTNDNIHDIFEDRSGLLWIGTQTGGVNIYNPATKYFHHQGVDENKPTTLSGKVIRGMAEDYLGYIWIGTQNSGVSRFDIYRDEYQTYRFNPDDPFSIPNDRVSAIYEDRDKELWVTTLGGLARYDRNQDYFITYRHDANDPNSIPTNKPISLYHSSNGTLWIGSRDKGLIAYNKIKNTYKSYLHERYNIHSISNNRIRPLLEDSSGKLWVGTTHGLNRFDPITETFQRFHHKPNDKTSISDDYIFSLHEDKSGRIWVGTRRGLNLYHNDTHQFTHFTQTDGLPNDNIYGILEELDQPVLWLSTNYGLSQLDLRSMTFKNFDVTHGLQNNEFNPPAALRTRSGMMIFGGIDGFNFFHPKAIKKNPLQPKVVITSVISENNQLITNKPFELKNGIELSHTDQVISFRYAALDFTNSLRNQFRYRLNGFDDAWQYGGNNQFVTYTNLDPGNYIFEVQGSNSDSVWSYNTASVKLKVHPAPWFTPWANLAYVTIFLLLIWFYVHRHQRELAKEREVATKLREVSALKDQFLATTSHELRTPMNGVIGTASLLLETPMSNEQRELVEMIRISSENLLSIINDILDFSRIEAGKIELIHHPFSLTQLIEEVLDIFTVQAQANGIEMAYFIAKSTPDKVIGDSQRIRQILINLVGNALKFTQKGQVTLTIKSVITSKNSQSFLKFTIVDSGIGIPKDKMKSLFEAFTQVDASTTRRFGGTGLGLAISQRLVKLMQGKIWVDSQVNRGTSFSFHIPLVKHSTNKEESLNPEACPFNSQKILLCHENMKIANIISQYLKRWKLDVSVFNTIKDNPVSIEEKDYQLTLINHNKKVTPTHKVKDILSYTKHKPVIFISPIPQEELIAAYEYQTFEIKAPIKWQKLYAMCSALLQISQFPQHDLLTTQNHPTEEIANLLPATILLAEDNSINQKIALQMLNRLGYQDVDTALNGQQAVEKCAHKHYDIILMDVQMPEMDGLTATREIVNQRTQPCHQHIIAMTANAMEGDKEKCIAAGMDSYLPKPVKMSQLRQQLYMALQDQDVELNVHSH
ncbi:MAG: two-component regulator propeller domain-containing protein [Pseudomonadota bacterium]